MKTRLTKTEKNRNETVGNWISSGCTSPLVIAIEWPRRGEGRAKAIIGGVIVAYAGGCGYCKESTVLADAASAIDQKIGKFGGHGVGAVARELLEYGYKLTCIYRNKNSDVYQIEKVV